MARLLISCNLAQVNDDLNLAYLLCDNILGTDVLNQMPLAI